MPDPPHLCSVPWFRPHVRPAQVRRLSQGQGGVHLTGTRPRAQGRVLSVRNACVTASIELCCAVMLCYAMLLCACFLQLYHYAQHAYGSLGYGTPEHFVEKRSRNVFQGQDPVLKHKNLEHSYSAVDTVYVTGKYGNMHCIHKLLEFICLPVCISSA